eukprot:GHVS01019616.1.p1 GENE.GHVS01019616.1~~GHVS01019616.1.p1  ORF type:complete len:2245 (-),score=229.17 GHVS01019616.1:358-7092(-)
MGWQTATKPLSWLLLPFLFFFITSVPHGSSPKSEQKLLTHQSLSPLSRVMRMSAVPRWKGRNERRLNADISQFEPLPKMELFVPSLGKGKYLSRDQSFTVTFNVAIVPVGGDVQSQNGQNMPFTVKINGVNVNGHGYWGTTSIYRWNLSDGDWTAFTDSEVEVCFDESLLSVSKRKVEGLGDCRRFRTKPLMAEIVSVTSEEAKKATGDRWRPTGFEDPRLERGYKSTIFFEVPQDGRVEILFSGPVDMSKLQGEVAKRFLLLHPNETTTSNEDEEGQALKYVDYSAVACADTDQTFAKCVVISFKDGHSLDGSTNYVLKLVKGVQYNSNSGCFGGEEDTIKDDLTGLQPFRFMFLEKPRVSSSRLLLAVRHGLNQSQVKQLKKQMKLTDDETKRVVDFDLTWEDACTLKMHAPTLEPGTAYSLNVEATDTVVDALEMALQGGELSFSTEPIRHKVALLESTTFALTPGQAAPWGVTALVRPTVETSETDYVKTEEARMLDLTEYSSTLRELMDAYHKFPTPATQRGMNLVSHSSTESYEDVDISFGESVDHLYALNVNQTGKHQQDETHIFRRRSFYGVYGKETDQVDNLKSVNVKFFNMQTGKAIVPTNMALFAVHQNTMEVLDVKTTEDITGRLLTVDFHPDENLPYKAYLAIQFESSASDVIYLGLFGRYWAAARRGVVTNGRIRVVLTSDRAVYKPSQKIKFTGWVFHKSGNAVTLLNECYRQEPISVVVLCTNDRQADATTAMLEVDMFGAFEGTIDAPEEPGFNWLIPIVFVDGEPMAAPPDVSGGEIEVIETRPPSLLLSLDLQSMVDSKGRLAVVGSVRDYLDRGSPLRSVNVTVRGKVRAGPLGQKYTDLEKSIKLQATGDETSEEMDMKVLLSFPYFTISFDIYTDTVGIFKKDIDIGHVLANAGTFDFIWLKEASSVKVEALVFGLTGEPVKSVAKVVVNDVPLAVGKTTFSPGTLLPGVPTNAHVVVKNLGDAAATNSYTMTMHWFKLTDASPSPCDHIGAFLANNLIPEGDGEWKVNEALTLSPVKKCPKTIIRQPSDGSVESMCNELGVDNYVFVSDIAMSPTTPYGRPTTDAIQGHAYGCKELAASRNMFDKSLVDVRVETNEKSYNVGDPVVVKLRNIFSANSSISPTVHSEETPCAVLHTAWNVNAEGEQLCQWKSMDVRNTLEYIEAPVGEVPSACEDNICSLSVILVPAMSTEQLPIFSRYEGQWSLLTEKGKYHFPPFHVLKQGMLHVFKIVPVVVVKKIDPKLSRKINLALSVVHSEGAKITFQPGDTISVDVAVELPFEDHTHYEAQLAVFFVDKTIIDQRPLPKLQVYPDCRADLSTPPVNRISWATTLDDLKSLEGFKQAAEALRSVYKNDRWSTDDFAFGGNACKTPEYMERSKTNTITHRWDEVGYDSGEATLVSGWSPRLNLSQRDPLIALFERGKMTRIGQKMKGSVPVRLPNKTGTFDVRAIVVMKKKKDDGLSELQWGQDRMPVVSTLPLSVQPYSQLFLRVGDTANLGVVLSADLSTDDGEKVRVEVDGVEHLTLKGSPTREIVVSQPTESVLWNVTASAVSGMANLKIVVKRDFADDDWQIVHTVEFSLEVLRLSELLTAGTCVLLSGDKGIVKGEGDDGAASHITTANVGALNQRTEKISVSRILEGEGGVAMIAGVGYKAAVHRFIKMLEERVQSSEVARGEDVLALAYAYTILKDAWGDETHNNEALAIYAKLKDYTAPVHDQRLGFLSSTWNETKKFADDFSCINREGYHQTGLACLMIDVDLTATAVIVVDAVKPPGGEVLRRILVEALSTYVSDQFAAYVVHNGVQAGTFLDYRSTSRLARLYYVLGPKFQFSKDISHVITFPEVVKRIEDNDTGYAFLWTSLTYGKHRQDLEWLETTLNNKSDRLKDFFNNIKVQSQMASFEKDGHQLPLMQQALFLQLFSQRSYDKDLLAKVATFTSGGGMNLDSTRFYSSGQTLISVIDGLAAVETLLGNEQISITFKATVEGEPAVPLYNHSFNSSKLGPITTKPWNSLGKVELTDQRSEWNVLFEANGSGTVWALLSMEFVLKENHIEPIARGVHVTKKYIRYDPLTKRCLPSEVVTFAVAQILLCSFVEIHIKDTLRDVEVKDSHPAGLEPTNCSADSNQSLWSWAFPLCYRRTAKDYTFWQCSVIRPGRHTFTSVLAPNLPGTYGIPPAVAQSLSQPEVMGSSAGTTEGITVAPENTESASCGLPQLACSMEDGPSSD